MFFGSQLQLYANGNIRPMRFLTGVAGAGNAGLAVEASASTQILLGISGRNTRWGAGHPADDGFIAVAGMPVPYFGPGMRCKLTLGGTVSSILVPLTSDSAGRGIAQAPSNGTTCWYGAVACQTGVENENIDVIVMSPSPTV